MRRLFERGARNVAGITDSPADRGGRPAMVARGADALDMAGGDGSQAVVAAVAADHGLPFVCEGRSCLRSLPMARRMRGSLRSPS
ncbi:MAG: hypothetical protein ABSA65_16665 [Acidimicrobiales bacterium]